MIRGPIRHAVAPRDEQAPVEDVVIGGHTQETSAEAWRYSICAVIPDSGAISRPRTPGQRSCACGMAPSPRPRDDNVALIRMPRYHPACRRGRAMVELGESIDPARAAAEDADRHPPRPDGMRRPHGAAVLPRVPRAHRCAPSAVPGLLDGCRTSSARRSATCSAYRCHSTPASAPSAPAPSPIRRPTTAPAPWPISAARCARSCISSSTPTGTTRARCSGGGWPRPGAR